MVWAAAICVIVLALIFLAPLRFCLWITGEGWPEWTVETVWLVIIRGSLHPGRRQVTVGKRRYTAAAVEEGNRRGWKRWLAASREERRSFIRLVKDIWQVMRVTVQGAGRYGFDDPALTAWVHGLILAAGVGRKTKKLRLEADFSQSGWWGTVELAVTFRLLSFILPTARFITAWGFYWIKAKYRGGTKHGGCECDGFHGSII